MATLTTLGLGRRPVRLRVVAFYRVRARAAAEVLPSGWTPRLVEGSAIGVVSYARLGSLESRFLPHRSATSHHLSCRIAAEADGEHTTWVAQRRTSSRFGAHGKHGRAAFELDDDAFGLTLRVDGTHREELFVRAHVCERTGTLLGTPDAVTDFLARAGEVRPANVFAPEADAIDASGSFAPEPLVVSELRSSFFDGGEFFPGACAQLDGAWRLVEKRVQPSDTRMQRRARAMRATEESSALPAV
jgi:hypothetical protein